MSQFLRDAILMNLSFSEDKLKKVDNCLTEIATEINSKLLALDESPNSTTLSLSYIIRFDFKGFLLKDFNKVMKHFNEADKVERIIYTLEDDVSKKSNRAFGRSIEITLNEGSYTNSTLVVTADDEAWVDATFSKIKETLDKFKNRNNMIRNNVTPFVIQIIAVLGVLLLSLLVGLKLSPYLSIQNSFVLTFIATFLLASNAWTFISPVILTYLNSHWPNISFKETGDIHWIYKAMIGTGLAYVLGQVLTYLYRELTHILK